MLTLGEVRGRILERANLTVAAEAFRHAEARGRVVQAAQHPNPYVALRRMRVKDFDWLDTGFGELEVGIPMELGGKRQARVRQAAAEAAAVSEEVRVVTANTLRDAELAFYRALRIGAELAISREQAKAAGEPAGSRRDPVPRGPGQSRPQPSGSRRPPTTRSWTSRTSSVATNGPAARSTSWWERRPGARSGSKATGNA